MAIIIQTKDLPTAGIYYRFKQIIMTPGPDIAPAEPTTKPETKPDTRPDQDDPFYFPAPKVDPTPKGFIFF